MARGGHGLPKVLLEPSMLYSFTSCRRLHLKWPYRGWPVVVILPPWIPHAVCLWCKGISKSVSNWRSSPTQKKNTTLKTWYNKSEGTNDFVLHTGVLLLQGLFVIKLITKWPRTKLVFAGIAFLKGSLLRGFNIHDLTTVETRSVVPQCKKFGN
jgi:hypothetical protein